MTHAFDADRVTVRPSRDVPVPEPTEVLPTLEEAEATLLNMAKGLFPFAAEGPVPVTWTDLPAGRGAERMTPEDRAHALEARFRTLVEQIPAVTFMAALGDGQNEIYVSPHVEALLGYTQAEWIANPVLWYARLHPDDRGIWNDEFMRGCLTGGPFRAECRFLSRDGKAVWVHGEARLVKDDRGRPMLLQGVAYDITESKRAQELLVADAQALEERVAERTRELVAANEALAREIADRRRVEAALRTSEEQLRESQKMEAIGRLAGGIAHDFNNALSIILSYSEVLTNAFKGGSPEAAGLREIERAAEHAAALTTQLLAFGRKQILAPTVVNLNEVVNGMRGLVDGVIGEDIDVRFDLAPSLGTVVVDARQVEQILVNLAVNARDAMPEGGTLTIATDDVVLDDVYASHHQGVVAGPHVVLSVTDSGCGMDAATLARVFEPFFTTKEVGKGSGLGLSTVFGIVQQSGGSIAVESEPEKGARFRIYFPRGAKGLPGAAHPGPGPGPCGGGETILLVEDNGQVREIASKLLKARGYNVLPAANAREAEIMSESFSGEIHLLLTDVVMPKVSGRQLAERLAPTRPTMRILFMSGYTNDTVVRNGVRTGFAFLSKPITPHSLAEKVRGVLDAAVPMAK